MEEVDKGCPMIRNGVSPGPKAVKRLCACVSVNDMFADLSSSS